MLPEHGSISAAHGIKPLAHFTGSESINTWNAGVRNPSVLCDGAIHWGPAGLCWRELAGNTAAG